MSFLVSVMMEFAHYWVAIAGFEVNDDEFIDVHFRDKILCDLANM